MKEKNEMKITTILGKGCVVSGDFKAAGSARIDGVIEGGVTVEEGLVLGAHGRIEGDIKAQYALIAGEVNGNIDATKKAELVTGAKVIGDVQTEVIVIDENAILQGRLNMNQTDVGRRVKAKAAKMDQKSAREALADALGDVEDALGQTEGMTQEDENLLN